MQTISIQEIKDLAGYEVSREQIRRNVVDLKKRRRVEVGEIVTLVFENRDTVLFQIQEMLRAERITAPERIQEEIDTYNTLIPNEGELSATVFIEIEDGRRLQETLPKLVGIEECVTLEAEGFTPVHADYERGRSRSDRTSTVHYVRFRLPAEARSALRSRRVPITIAIKHPNYEARTTLSSDQLSALAQDLD